MTGLREPPKQEKTSRIVARLLVLVLLLAVVAIAIWSATTRTLMNATEDVSLADLEIETRQIVGGLGVNVVTEEGGPTPVVLLNGYDIAGGVVWDGVVPVLGESYHAVRIDLPGFGLSDRLPEPGTSHTVASMAEVVAGVLDADAAESAVFVGVGLGGEVAAELAVIRPDLVLGLVLIDVDFWEEGGWLTFAQRLPFVGEATTYTFEGAGRLGVDRWAPHCGEGGWCPTQSQVEAREVVASVEGTTVSLQAFLETPAASLVPSDLDLISTKVVYLWSESGGVSKSNVDRAIAEIGSGPTLVGVEAYQAHLEAPDLVVQAVDTVGG